jgi:hypothetical protein
MCKPFLARGIASVICVTGLIGCVLIATAGSPARAETPVYELEPINYSAAAPDDPAAKLKTSLEKGEVKLAPVPQRGYLDALLRELKISSASQVVVFTKTSFQRNVISPSNPRALYFNDDTYIGYVPDGEVLEVASVDPKIGTVFYTVDQKAGAHEGRFTRQTESCLQCHGDSMTHGVPGLLVRSVFSDNDGMPILPAGTFLTTHESPLKDRWGGWYVTGSTGARQHHMGNTLWKEQEGGSASPLSKSQGPLKDLTQKIDTSAYLTPHSDVVALMVLEHQVEAHNRITQASYGTERALRDEKVMADALGEPLKPGVHSQSTLGRIKNSCEPLVEYLLFANEAPLAEPVEGSASFASEFSARGPRDSKGRSLRDFDLKSRLFRYPCSYLIYSRSIDRLPDAAKTYLFRRLGDVLSGRDQSKPFVHLSGSDRTAIAEILRETKPEIAAAWKHEAVR